MSQENVEIVRRVYDAYLSGDFEAALAMMDLRWNGMARSVPKAGSTADMRGGRGAANVDRGVGGIQARS
jgi:hypothetical protein